MQSTGMPYGLERLEKLDQSTFVIVAQRRLLREGAGAEVMTAVNDQVRALAQLHQRLLEVGKRPGGIRIGGSAGQARKILLRPEEKLEHTLLIGCPLHRIPRLRNGVQVRK